MITIDDTSYEPGKGSAHDYVPAWMNVPKLYSTETQDDPLVLIKLFTADSLWTWYITEYDGDDTLFGLVVGFETEIGYFSLSEIQSVKGPMGLRIERDLWFEPTPITDVPEYQAKWGKFGGPYKGSPSPGTKVFDGKVTPDPDLDSPDGLQERVSLIKSLRGEPCTVIVNDGEITGVITPAWCQFQCNSGIE